MHMHSDLYSGAFDYTDNTYWYKMLSKDPNDIKKYCSNFDIDIVDLTRYMKIRTKNGEKYRKFKFSDVINPNTSFQKTSEFIGDFDLEIAIPLKIKGLAVLEKVTVKNVGTWYDDISQFITDKCYHTQMKVLHEVTKELYIDITEELNTFVIDGLYPDNPRIGAAKADLRNKTILKIAERTENFSPEKVNALFYDALKQLGIVNN